MSIARTAAKVEWGSIISTLSLKGSTATSLQAFRKRNEDARRKVTELSAQSTEVDFAYYRSVLKNTAVVSEIENAYKSFKPVTYDVKEQLAAISTFEAKALSNAKLTEEKVLAELVDLEKTLDNIQSARSFDELTLDDVSAARPDIEAKVSEMVVKGRWNVPGYAEKFGSLAVM
ncbi:uncharacterized protein V1510DRAFT_400693 [Dipodascopsis tothii]|uniref:uncharacterized protein n=1 Tax=Dipodascopsis tothii TaxID=44089 RepID=UPI0034CE2C51